MVKKIGNDGTTGKEKIKPHYSKKKKVFLIRKVLKDLFLLKETYFIKGDLIFP